MQKMVLLPFDRYRRPLSSHPETCSEKVIEDNPPGRGASNYLEQEAEKTDLVTDNYLSADKLVSLFPKSLQSRARALFTYILPYISWNKKGEVIISGETITCSYIVDLIKVHLKDYKDFLPTGVREFYPLHGDLSLGDQFFRHHRNSGQKKTD